jgi:hypothetical protein
MYLVCIDTSMLIHDLKYCSLIWERGGASFTSSLVHWRSGAWSSLPLDAVGCCVNTGYILAAWRTLDTIWILAVLYCCANTDLL